MVFQNLAEATHVLKSSGIVSRVEEKGHGSICLQIADREVVKFSPFTASFGELEQSFDSAILSGSVKIQEGIDYLRPAGLTCFFNCHNKIFQGFRNVQARFRGFCPYPQKIIVITIQILRKARRQETSRAYSVSPRQNGGPYANRT